MASAQNEGLLKNTRSMLRSVLLSAPRGVRARNLEAEYRGITGKIIPYRELGYRSLKDFMTSLQDVARLSTSEGEPTYHGVADASTAHIAKMVSKQKKPKRKSQPVFNPAKKQHRGGARGYAAYRVSSRPERVLRSLSDREVSKTTYSERVTSQPERVVRLVSDSLRVTSTDRGNQFNRRWKEAKKVDIVNFVTNFSLKSVELVQITGYIQSPPEETTIKGLRSLRTLVCANNRLVVGQGQSVMCHFFFSDWNYKPSQGPWKLREKQKITLYGQPWVKSSAKFKESMALKVLHYELNHQLAGPAIVAQQPVSPKGTKTPESTTSNSPDPPRDNTELEHRIYQIIKDTPNGVWLDRVKVLYQREYGCPINDLEAINTMSSVRLDEVAPGQKILYPRGEPANQIAAKEKPVEQVAAVPSSNKPPPPAVAMVTNDEIPPPTLPKPEEHMKVLVSHVEGPDLFYVQVCNDVTIKSFDWLEQMTPCLNEVSEVLKNCSVGEYCAALYPSDDRWYRGVVSEVKMVRGSKSKSYRVQYIDYGNTETVSDQQLTRLPYKFWSTPMIAIPCALSLDKDLDYNTSQFSQLIVNKIFFIEVKSIEQDVLVVDMYTETNNTSVASLLEEKYSKGEPPLPDYALPPADENCCVDVYVTLVMSPANFYLQFIGEDYYDKLVSLEKQLEEWFDSNKPQPVTMVTLNKLLLYYEEDQPLSRALVLSVEDDNYATIQLVDHGHQLTVAKDKLTRLPNKFWKLPFQARQCYLYECFDFVDNDSVSEEFTQLAEDQYLVALIVDSSGSRLAVQLTDGNQKSINNLLKSKYCPVTELRPKLPEVGKVTKGTVTHINPQGKVTLLLDGPGTTKLQQIEQHLNKMCDKKEISADMFVNKMVVGLRCVAKQQNGYYRAEVTKILSGTEVEVRLVDYGTLVTMEKLSIRNISDSSVWALPYQGVTCCLDNLPPPKGQWTEKAADYLKQKCCQEVTIQTTSDTPPSLVRLYLEDSDDEEDVNDCLRGQPQLFGLSWEQAGEDNNKSDDTDCHGDCEDSCSQQEGNPPETTLNTNLNSNNINCDPDGVSQNGTAIIMKFSALLYTQ
ncbi:tudor domain-containing protein 7-like isoform X2 [Dysidea avara]|uniref:tudor domain-containing protein 7-like isoform X2 n=1 Tax=Dysidea avara TaxID=196820 RepID=UPI00332CF887